MKEFVQSIMIVPDSPTLSLLIWSVLLIVMLYLARQPAHKAIHSLGQVFYRTFRSFSRALSMTEQKMRDRNREVLFESGKEAAERLIEREFYRIDTVVKHDLADYPVLHRSMQDGISKIEEDYTCCNEDIALPSIQGWEKAVDAVAKIPTKNSSSMVTDVLQDINRTFSNSYRDALDEYRQVCNDRLSVMNKMAPVWRNISRSLNKVDKNIENLNKRASEIGGYMDRYEEVQRQTNYAERTLSSSSITQFFIAGLVLAIAIGGAMVNFNLIAYPMQEMVGGNSYLMGFKTANIAAIVIILVEISMGLFLMELLRITQLFPMISSIDDKMRRRLIVISFSILFTLACVESALAFMRDIMAADNLAFKESLKQGAAGAGAAAAAEGRVIPMIAQMVIGFILPFALVFVAIPLEAFIHSSRAVLGIIAVWIVRTVAMTMRMAGIGSRQAGEFLIQLYDLIIFVPLWVEKHVHERFLKDKARKMEIMP